MAKIPEKSPGKIPVGTVMEDGKIRLNGVFRVVMPNEPYYLSYKPKTWRQKLAAVLIRVARRLQK